MKSDYSRFDSSVESIELNLQYVERRDENPFFSDISGPEFETRGALGELIFRPEGDDSKWYSAALCNWVESDDNALDYKSATINLGYLLRRNFRIAGEFTYNFTGEFGQVVSD
jgi:hypothetical protein